MIYPLIVSPRLLVSVYRGTRLVGVRWRDLERRVIASRRVRFAHGEKKPMVFSTIPAAVRDSIDQQAAQRVLFTSENIFPVQGLGEICTNDPRRIAKSARERKVSIPYPPAASGVMNPEEVRRFA